MKSTAYLLVLLLFGAAVHAEIYKWVDEDGNVQFTDTPPPNQEVEEVDIKGATTPSMRNTHGEQAAAARDDDQSPGDLADRELCTKAVRNLSRYAPVWERMIRDRFPAMSAADRAAAEQSIVAMNADLKKLKANMSECTKDMGDPENRRNAECIASAPDAETAMFCVL